MTFSFMKRNLKVGVIGLWHLGSVYAASLARMGIDVVCFDYDKKVLADFKKNIPPIFEPGLKEALKKYKKKLYFTAEIKKTFSNTDYIFVTFDLPVDEKDEVDLGLIRKTFPLIVKYIQPQTTVIVSSQVPLGTCRLLVESLKKKRKHNRVVYFPENLRLGDAFSSFLSPDRIILGCDDQNIGRKFKADFKFKCPVIAMKLESAEMVKHALNTYLATCISYSSELSDLCERLGANMQEVVQALKSDSRVSPKAPLNPGLGFAGGTLGRDLRSVQKLGQSINYKTKLVNAIYEVNKDRLPYLINKVKNNLRTLKGKKICILGLTYKPNTDTLRRSMSLELSSRLAKEKVTINAYDPFINKNISRYSYINIFSSPEKAAQNCDAIIIMTEHSEFKNINPKKLLLKGKTIFDTKNFLDKSAYEKAGFIVNNTGA